ncbi:MAG: glycosyltransferase family 2 protein [Trueperaceae bacterium]
MSSSEPGQGPGPTPQLSILIPTHSRRLLLDDLLTKLEEYDGPTLEVIVIDDASSDGTSEMLTRHPNVRVLRNEVGRGFDALPDAVRMARAELIMQLDDDAWPAAGSLEKVVQHFEQRGPQLGMVALPFVEPESGRRAYTPYLPKVAEGQAGHVPTRAFYQGAVVFRRQAALQVPPSPPGYFMYGTEPVTAIELLAAGWEADFLPSAPIFHLWEARGQKVDVRSAVIMLRNDLATFRRYYRGWRRLDLMVGRYLTGLVHLLAAGAPWAFGRAMREADELLELNPPHEVDEAILTRMLPCFDGLGVTTFFGETNRRRAAWFLGWLPADQAC